MIHFVYGFDWRHRDDYIARHGSVRVVRCGIALVEIDDEITEVDGVPLPFEPTNNPLPRVDTRDIVRPRARTREIRSAS